MSLDFGIGDITADKQTSIDRAYREKTRHQRLGTEAPKPTAPGTRASAPKTTPKLTKTDVKAMTAQAAAKEHQAQGARKASLLRIYENYYARPEFKNLLPRKAVLTPEHSLKQIEEHLSNVRHALNAKNAGVTIRKLYPSLVELIIKLLGHAGALEAVGLEGAQGAGEALAPMMESPMMQTEVAEMEIELQDWFASGWQMRIAVKTYMFMRAYAQANNVRNKTTELSAAAAAALNIPQPQTESST